MTGCHVSGVRQVMLLWPLGVYMAICNVVDMKGVIGTGCCDGCMTRREMTRGWGIFHQSARESTS